MGYTFSGWYSDAGLTTSYTFSVMSAQNITLYAKWTINQYTITFNSNGGIAVNPITQNYGTAVSAPTQPTRTGYTFSGWYSDIDTMTLYSFTTMPAQNITLYAGWTVTLYTISFNSNGGTAVNPISAQEGTAITKPTDPTKTGFVFDGWYTDNNTFVNQFTFITMPPLNLTLYAKWLTPEQLVQKTVSDIQQLVLNGWFNNISVSNLKTETMEAGILLRVQDIISMYPGISIQIINGQRSGSTYIFTFTITYSTAQATIQNVKATFI
jgi:uncharacterized repeat protein (TIGR02543 family)